MKRNLFLAVCFALISGSAFSQITVDIFINGIKSGQYKLTDNQATGGISYKKSVYKGAEKLSIQLSGKSVDGPYFRKVEVMGDDEKPLFIAPETDGAAGQFILTDKAVLKRLSKGKSVKLMVEKTPSNTKSTEAIRKIYIGTLSVSK